MARFFWDSNTTDELVRTKELQQITGSQEFMVSDPKADPVLYKAQQALLVQFSDDDIIFKIKGNISKLLTLEYGFNTPVEAAPLLRGLMELVSHAETRHTKSPWDHEELKDIAENVDQFFAKIKSHDKVPTDIVERIGDVGLEQISFRDILANIFDIHNVKVPEATSIEKSKKVVLDNTLDGVRTPGPRPEMADA